MIRHFQFAQYDEPMDLVGKDLIGLTGAPREKVRALIPSLVAPATMRRRWGFTKKLRAYNGEVADEVHEFSHATQGEYRLKRILLREGRFVEVGFQW